MSSHSIQGLDAAQSYIHKCLLLAAHIGALAGLYGFRIVICDFSNGMGCFLDLARNVNGWFKLVLGSEQKR